MAEDVSEEARLLDQFMVPMSTVCVTVSVEPKSYSPLENTASYASRR